MGLLQKFVDELLKPSRWKIRKNQPDRGQDLIVRYKVLRQHWSNRMAGLLVPITPLRSRTYENSVLTTGRNSDNPVDATTWAYWTCSLASAIKEKNEHRGKIQSHSLQLPKHSHMTFPYMSHWDMAKIVMSVTTMYSFMTFGVVQVQYDIQSKLA